LDRVVTHEDGSIALHTPAVILIDEIDAHLHPAWQRDIGPWLTSHFPLAQFIVTTHSPLVCQAATGGRIYVLPAPGAEESPRRVSAREYERLLASDTDTVLASAAFQVHQPRPTRVVKAMQRHAHLQQLALFDMPILDTDTEKELSQLQSFFESGTAS